MSRSLRSLGLASTSYVAPLKPGELAACNEALQFLAADNDVKLAQLESLTKLKLEAEMLKRVKVDA